MTLPEIAQLTDYQIMNILLNPRLNPEKGGLPAAGGVSVAADTIDADAPLERGSVAEKEAFFLACALAGMPPGHAEAEWAAKRGN